MYLTEQDRSKTTIFALDQSTTRTGWAYISGDELVCSGVLDATKIKGGVERRIQYVGKKLIWMLRMYRPSIVVYEGVQVRRNVRTAMVLAQLQGAVLLAAGISSKPTDVIAPSEWRRAMSFDQGRNHTETDLKAQAINYVFNEFGMKVGADEAEAICIGVAYLRKLTSGEIVLKKPQRSKAEETVDSAAVDNEVATVGDEEEVSREKPVGTSLSYIQRGSKKALRKKAK